MSLFVRRKKEIVFFSSSCIYMYIYGHCSVEHCYSRVTEKGGKRGVCLFETTEEEEEEMYKFSPARE